VGTQVAKGEVGHGLARGDGGAADVRGQHHEAGRAGGEGSSDRSTTGAVGVPAFQPR
jgi:hypothetical protein